MILCFGVNVQMREEERERLIELSKFEKEAYEKGYKCIAGIDEAGRGPLAGPVVAAAVILPKDALIEGVNDSKKLSEKKREKLYDDIINKGKSEELVINIIDRTDEYESLLNTIYKFILL